MNYTYASRSLQTCNNKYASRGLQCAMLTYVMLIKTNQNKTITLIIGSQTNKHPHSPTHTTHPPVTDATPAVATSVAGIAVLLLSPSLSRRRRCC